MAAKPRCWYAVCLVKHLVPVIPSNARNKFTNKSPRLFRVILSSLSKQTRLVGACAADCRFSVILSLSKDIFRWSSPDEFIAVSGDLSRCAPNLSFDFAQDDRRICSRRKASMPTCPSRCSDAAAGMTVNKAGDRERAGHGTPDRAKLDVPRCGTGSTRGRPLRGLGITVPPWPDTYDTISKVRTTNGVSTIGRAAPSRVRGG